MKNKLAVLLIILSAVLIQAGCKSSGPVSVLVNGENVVLAEIDAANDTLLDRKPDEGIDFELEKSIFAPLLNEAEVVPVPLGSIIEINFEKDFDSVILYDHLLKEDGSSYFDRMIAENVISLKDNQALLKLSEHVSEFLASDSELFKDGSIRGFRLVAKSGEDIQEYAFAVYVLPVPGLR